MQVVVLGDDEEDDDADGDGDSDDDVLLYDVTRVVWPRVIASLMLLLSLLAMLAGLVTVVDPLEGVGLLNPLRRLQSGLDVCPTFRFGVESKPLRICFPSE